MSNDFPSASKCGKTLGPGSTDPLGPKTHTPERHRLPYLISLPERSVRSTGALAGGFARELSEVVLPSSFRKTKIYRSLVDVTLRFIVEQVGQVEKPSDQESRLPSDFALRRSAGNGIEMAGILLFRFSPVWVLAALSDLSSTGRVLIREISESLQEKGLLERNVDFASIDEILDGLEKTSGRLADNLNAPPFDVQVLRREWQLLRQEAGKITPKQMPSKEQLAESWQELREEAHRQDCSVFELSSLMALSAVTQLPAKALWLSQCATAAAGKTGMLLASTLLSNYTTTLKDIQEAGYLHYWARQLKPYVSAAARSFSPSQSSYTERFLQWCVARGRKA
ncbi:MAG: hypothetical protein L0387_26275 [Acidobacteria bacterium]|nr:hypothetical protein [Acidobacteriota bacterium]MCI0718955.1 hypothetical protein [Acidobacteriota bacterium]